jgi:hypothetical protein
VRLQITFDYMKNCNRLQLITIIDYDYPISESSLCQHGQITILLFKVQKREVHFPKYDYKIIAYVQLGL